MNDLQANTVGCSISGSNRPNFCYNCAEKIEAAWNFCDGCGKRVQLAAIDLSTYAYVGNAGVAPLTAGQGVSACRLEFLRAPTFGQAQEAK